MIHFHLSVDKQCAKYSRAADRKSNNTTRSAKMKEWKDEDRDMIVRGGMAMQFMRTFSDSFEPGEPITPYIVKLAKAIVG